MENSRNPKTSFYFFLLLLFMSAVSTVYLLFQGGYFFSSYDSFSHLHKIDPLQVKEVSFAEFLVRFFRNIFEILK